MKKLTILSNLPVAFADITFDSNDRSRLTFYSEQFKHKNRNEGIETLHLNSFFVRELLSLLKEITPINNDTAIKVLKGDYEVTYCSKFFAIQNCRIAGSTPMVLFKENPKFVITHGKELFQQFLYRLQEVCSEFINVLIPSLDGIKPLKTLSGTDQYAHISEKGSVFTIWHVYNASNGISLRVKNPGGVIAFAIRTPGELNNLKELRWKIHECFVGKVFCGMTDKQKDGFNPDIIPYTETYVSNGFVNKQHRSAPLTFTISHSGQYLQRRINLHVNKELTSFFDSIVYKIEKELDKNYILNEEGLYLIKGKSVSEVL
ncbi:hypothetical protein [Aeromonas phage AerS_266]|nr:hypothetical protein [Aeromonas phage AerS_266]